MYAYFHGESHILIILIDRVLVGGSSSLGVGSLVIDRRVGMEVTSS